MGKDELIAKYTPKLEAEELEWSELPEVMDLMVLVANDDEDFEEEFGEFTKAYLFNVTDKPEAEWMWLKVEAGKFSAGSGKIDNPDLTFTMSAENALGMVSGAIDSNSAYMKGDLKIEGAISDGVKFQNIQALFRDILDI